MGFQIYLCFMLITLTKSSGDSSEEHLAYIQPYAPPAVVFHDIYPPGHSPLPEETPIVPVEEDFRSNTITTQFVEFHPQVLKIQPITPAPRVLLNSSYIKPKEVKSNVSVTTTTHEPEEMPIPSNIPRKNYQRGVLDLLLPPSRVRTFKNVFDTVRRMLSYTF